MDKKLKYIIGGVGIVIVLLLTFQVGVMFGFHRANFGYHWSQNYEGNFSPKPMMGRGGMMKAHGAIGEIIKIDGSILTVKGQDEAEKIILVDAKTKFEKDDVDVKATDLKVGDSVFVIGTPNDAGQVTAKVLRIVPTINNQK